MSQASVTPPGYGAAGYQQNPARSLVNPMWAAAARSQQQRSGNCPERQVGRSNADECAEFGTVAMFATRK
jgi:hypothetical protein